MGAITPPRLIGRHLQFTLVPLFRPRQCDTGKQQIIPVDRHFPAPVPTGSGRFLAGTATVDCDVIMVWRDGYKLVDEIIGHALDDTVATMTSADSAGSATSPRPPYPRPGLAAEAALRGGGRRLSTSHGRASP
ncbi:hypothetical protein GCM10010156_77870 [Planobispora rosea]|uniref:Uncharacterized protein n=1 Tax=Planobispora rosea TaxID=35762 RepID=A0A8J3S0W6_PLARO|nr:hypothetical protein GCM10010156_77870 [Planobispora rosea]GIH86501.1 hypothetical protein Pro02_49090 [Planobispora rosea]